MVAAGVPSVHGQKRELPYRLLPLLLPLLLVMFLLFRVVRVKALLKLFP